MYYFKLITNFYNAKIGNNQTGGVTSLIVNYYICIENSYT